MDPNLIAQDTISGALSAVIAALLMGAIAWLAWPFRWWLQGLAVKRMISDERHFSFVFNPANKSAKEVTFLANGNIGKGRNNNEHAWRIKKGALEIIGSDGKVYSRFRHDRSQGVLKHTNDPELRSIPGQYLQPSFVRVSQGET